MPSISRCISFREVVLSITVSTTESCPPEEGSLLGSPGSLPLPDEAPFVEVCWRMEILVAIGIPGMSFSATAFRIADFRHQFAPLNATSTITSAELYLRNRGVAGLSNTHLTFPCHYDRSEHNGRQLSASGSHWQESLSYQAEFCPWLLPLTFRPRR